MGRDNCVRVPNNNVDSLAYISDLGPVISVADHAFSEPIYIVLEKINYNMQEHLQGRDIVHNQPLVADYRMQDYCVFGVLDEHTLPFTIATYLRAEQEEVVPS